MNATSDGPESGPAQDGYWRNGIRRVTELDIETRRRRLHFRAWHRGIRETDIIMGRFADAEIASFTLDDIIAFERVLEIPDHDILAWVTGAVPVPAESCSPMLARVLAFHGTR